MNDVGHAAEGREGRQTLGKYDLIAALGRGGMADVYLATLRGPSGFHKLVVLKALRGELSANDEFVEMFMNEARLAGRLNHPNVVQTNEVDEDEGQLFLVMEYLDGCPYASLEALVRRGEVPLAVGVRVLCDALAGLHYAHSLTDLSGKACEIVHRDVSPQNIFVTYDGQVKVLDFGIAKAANSATTTRTGTVKGKVRYMAPEQVVGGRVDRRADVFAVGILLWRLLAKKSPWEGLSDVAIMHKLVAGEPVAPPSSLQPDVPAGLNDACVKALARSPDDRFQSAGEMRMALEEYLNVCGPRGSARAVADVMAAQFGRKRDEFRRAVDGRLLALEQGAPVEAFASSTRIKKYRVAPLFEGDDERSSGTMRARTPRGTPISHTSPGTSAAHVMSSGPAPPRSRAGWWVAAFALSAAAAGLWVWRGGHAPARTATSGAVTAAEVAPSPSAPPVASGQPVPSVSLPAAPGPSTANAASPVAPRAVANGAPASRRAVASAAPGGAAPAVAAPAAKPETDCSSPFFLDARGLKKIKPECL